LYWIWQKVQGRRRRSGEVFSQPVVGEAGVDNAPVALRLIQEVDHAERLQVLPQRAVERVEQVVVDAVGLKLSSWGRGTGPCRPAT
jgi:hypothetical protein